MLRKLNKWVTGSLQTKTTLLIVGIMLALLTGFIFYDVQSQRNTLEGILLQKGTDLAQSGAVSIGHVLEDAIATGRLTEAQVFDTDYKPIPGTNPQKYHTAYDAFTDANILPIEDAYLKDEEVLFAVTVDVNGYLPTHNTRYTKALTGDYQTDMAGNRTKRLFNDPVGLAAGQNTQPILTQLYPRDTGEMAWDISAPIYVKGKHWGGFRVALSLTKVEAEQANAMWRILAAALLLVMAIGVAAFLIARSIAKPLASVVTLIQEMGKGHLGMRLKMSQQDEIGVLARAMDQFADDLQSVVVGTMKKISDGDLSTEVSAKDKQDEISPALVSTTLALRGLVAETKMLTQAAVEGKLATRADASKFQGDYRQVVQGINDTLDAVIGPLNVAAEYMDRISKGDIPAKITEDYHGDLDGIKTSLNSLIDNIKMREVDLNTLLGAALEGNLGVRVDAKKYADYNVKLMDGMNSLLDSIVAPIQETRRILEQVARGDLTVKLNGHYKGDFVALRSGIEALVNGLKGMAGQTQQSAVLMTSATSQILASSTEMASTTREQASAVNQITSTVQEIKSSAEQVAQNAQRVTNTANQATTAAENGMMAVEETTAGMNDIQQKVEAIAENILALSEKTQQIGDIIDTVSDIAGQSNILALNAAIEAAQAGEAGKGFRVVADEVRSLSEQSRQAAGQVKVILGDIQKATNQAVMATEQGTKGVQAGTERVNRTAEIITQLAQAVAASTQAAQQIVAGVEQQTVGLDQIATGMKDINQAAQQSAVGAQESQKAAQELNQVAEQLKQAVAQYHM